MEKAVEYAYIVGKIPKEIAKDGDTIQSFESYDPDNYCPSLKELLERGREINKKRREEHAKQKEDQTKTNDDVPKE